MIYITLGSKGGIGKTSISALLAEYLTSTGKEVFCLDLDAENASFSKYKGLEAKHIDTKNHETGEIDKRKFDEIVPLILDNKERDIVIDTGSTTYTPFATYFAENDISGLLKEEGIETTLIGIVMGGGNTLDSLNALKKMSGDFHETKLMIFNNQLNGSTTYNDVKMQDTKVLKSLEDRTVGIVDIAQKSGYLFDNISDFSQKRLLFSDLKENETFGMMERRRLTVYRDEIFKQLEENLKA
jgi:hypothetical protein